jgi:hypothetical protein
MEDSTAIYSAEAGTSNWQGKTKSCLSRMVVRMMKGLTTSNILLPGQIIVVVNSSTPSGASNYDYKQYDLTDDRAKLIWLTRLGQIWKHATSDFDL